MGPGSSATVALGALDPCRPPQLLPYMGMAQQLAWSYIAVLV